MIYADSIRVCPGWLMLIGSIINVRPNSKTPQCLKTGLLQPMLWGSLNILIITFRDSFDFSKSNNELPFQLLEKIKLNNRTSGYSFLKSLRIKASMGCRFLRIFKGLVVSMKEVDWFIDWPLCITSNYYQNNNQISW